MEEINNTNSSLTSVKVNNNIFDEFRMITIKTKFNLQKLVNNTMSLYNTSETFRKLVHNPSASGSLSF